MGSPLEVGYCVHLHPANKARQGLGTTRADTYVSDSAFIAACDILLALLPWKILLQFRMYRREKIGIAIAMSMGIL